jgi:ABC-type multidrug transport system ATPase subunit
MIDIEHVGKRFGRITALDDVCLTFQPGDRIALVGSNGSGKTTLLRALLGLIRVDGRVVVRGHDVAHRPELALRELAYVPQIAPPIDAPVSEVVRAYARIRGMLPTQVAAAAATFQLNLGNIHQSRFRDLSGGMKQKLLAAMALAAGARILICDEPTANLDAEARAAFFEALDALPSDALVVLCSHRVDELQDFVNRVVELKDGRVASDTRTLNSSLNLAAPPSNTPPREKALH